MCPSKLFIKHILLALAASRINTYTNVWAKMKLATHSSCVHDMNSKVA